MGAVLAVFHYQTSDKRIPYREWLDTVRNPVAFAAVQLRVDRLERDTGCITDSRGSKSCCCCVAATRGRTSADIRRAKEYWKDHEERKRAGGRAG